MNEDIKKAIESKNSEKTTYRIFRATINVNRFKGVPRQLVSESMDELRASILDQAKDFMEEIINDAVAEGVPIAQLKNVEAGQATGIFHKKKAILVTFWQKSKTDKEGNQTMTLYVYRGNSHAPEITLILRKKLGKRKKLTK